jgi:bifunctional DNA-binding transcriptional regulator/antitoxin component of YhaV-PrlF toxin-antitoxin module
MRKIIKVGETSFAIILPKAWLRYYKLTDKDRLRVISNSRVVIEPSGKKRKEQFQVNETDIHKDGRELKK